MNFHQLINQSKENTDLLTVEATVITGFEFLALDECREKCKPVSISKAKGRIFFNIPAKDFNKVLTLRAVDNVLLVIETIKDIPFEGKKDKDLELVKSLVDIVDWDKSLKKWAEITEFKGILYPNKTSDSPNDGLVKRDLMGKLKEIETSHLEKAASRNECIDIASPDKKISESIVETCNPKDDLSKPNEEETTNKNKLVLSSIDINDEEVYKSEKEVVDAPQEMVSSHLIYEQEETNDISDKETLRELDEDENNISQLEEVTSNCEKNSDDSKENEYIQEKPISDSTREKVVNLCENKEPINDGDIYEGDFASSKEESSAHLDQNRRTLSADNRPHRKQQPRGRNKHFAQRKPTDRRGQKDSTSDQGKSEENDGVLKFRATCYRIGEKHSFSSMEAAYEFGGMLQDKFGWTVDLTRFNLNVVLNIEYKQGYICVAVTKESLHRRNISHFSNTTLRATMCYNLFRLAEPMTGEIVVDPLCGGGSISLEVYAKTDIERRISASLSELPADLLMPIPSLRQYGIGAICSNPRSHYQDPIGELVSGALSFPNTYHICGDYNRKAIERTRANIDFINRTKTHLKVGAVYWDMKNLPLRPQSVDVLVTDLPFGKRSGAKRDNLRLYCRFLFELAKVVKTGTGRACLLTYDKTSLIRALRSQSMYWREIRQFGVNQGGLFSSVFLLLRKAIHVTETSREKNIESVPQTDISSSSQDVTRIQDESIADDSAEKMSYHIGNSSSDIEMNDKSSGKPNVESNDTNLQNNVVNQEYEQ